MTTRVTFRPSARTREVSPPLVWRAALATSPSLHGAAEVEAADGDSTVPLAFFGGSGAGFSGVASCALAGSAEAGSGSAAASILTGGLICALAGLEGSGLGGSGLPIAGNAIDEGNCVWSTGGFSAIDRSGIDEAKGAGGVSPVSAGARPPAELRTSIMRRSGLVSWEAVASADPARSSTIRVTPGRVSAIRMRLNSLSSICSEYTRLDSMDGRTYRISK